MRQRAIKRAQGLIARRLRARHQGIRPTPEAGLFNFRCHENCVEYLHEFTSWFDRRVLGVGRAL